MYIENKTEIEFEFISLDDIPKPNSWKDILVIKQKNKPYYDVFRPLELSGELFFDAIMSDYDKDTQYCHITVNIYEIKVGDFVRRKGMQAEFEVISINYDDKTATLDFLPNEILILPLSEIEKVYL